MSPKASVSYLNVIIWLFFYKIHLKKLNRESLQPNWMHVMFYFFPTGEIKMLVGKMRCLCLWFLNEMTLQFVGETSLPSFMDKLQVQTDNLETAAVYNVISFFSPARGRPLHPPTVSWAVQCVLTLDHLPVSPMSNANRTGRQQRC